MRHNLNINGKVITADAGETLVDAALAAKILIPHDCATGQCETCRVHIPWGRVDEGGTAYGDTVLACQARVKTDATITFETAPPAQNYAAIVEAITPLSHNVSEVVASCAETVPYRPGQYAKVSFQGFPPREYSFCAPMSADPKPYQMTFQIQHLPRGKVSSALGESITPGHKIRLTGPFGNAFLREQEDGPLVLASSGTGFAPIWSLARAVVQTGSKRPLTLVTGVRTPRDCYMTPAFQWLKENCNAEIRITSRSQAENFSLSGTPDRHLPMLNELTTVHVAGNPNLVEKTKMLALASNATCYADPFTPSKGGNGWGAKMARFCLGGFQ